MVSSLFVQGRARWAAWGAVLAMTLVGMSASAGNAAVPLPQRWSTSTIKYYIPSSQVSYSTWTGADALWTGIDATLVYSQSSPHISALQENRGNTVDWTGVTRKPGTVESYPAYSGSYWTSGMQVVLNWSLMTSLGYTSTQRKMVAAHEFGHAFGLDHNPAYLSGSPGVPLALMYPYDDARIAYGILGPKADDKGGVNAKY